MKFNFHKPLIYAIMASDIVSGSKERQLRQNMEEIRKEERQLLFIACWK